MNQAKAQEALRMAQELAEQSKSATDFHNAYFGVAGKFAELFPRRVDREAFASTPEYQEILRLRAGLAQAEQLEDWLRRFMNTPTNGYENPPIKALPVGVEEIVGRFMTVFNLDKGVRAKLEGFLRSRGYCMGGYVTVNGLLWDGQKAPV